MESEFIVLKFQHDKLDIFFHIVTMQIYAFFPTMELHENAISETRSTFSPEVLDGCRKIV